MMVRPAILALTLFFFAIGRSILAADAQPSTPPMPKVPDGFSIELAAGPPLIERPIVASFDDEGRLYVAESSGSNDKVQVQLEQKPHRIVRLEDTDGDGKFDKRIVFADKMMFPEGVLCFDGSVYVAAPPSIWKLTDTNGDGVADERVEWFKGGTLTGCANDLHGPYAGPDGYIYWCKGAFAEQTHMVNGKEWKTKASHVFRCRPDGSGFEPVITCGMDNPVDVVFMPDGEMILSGTLFNGNPRHDGLAHAIYGGVYGKEHNVLDGHPRTGELMPLLVTMSPVACSGLERYDSDIFGPEYRDNLFLCQFNMRKVSRHVLKPLGSTYTSEDHDFVTSDFVDFHPTDVQVDADGSLLVIDTGGWYKLCCPTSQLWKPDVLGGIYRVRKIGAKAPDDPWGKRINWAHQSIEQLWALLADKRFAIRQHATREFVHRNNSRDIREYVEKLDRTDNRLSVFYDVHSPQAPIARVWAISQLDTTWSRLALQALLLDSDARRAAHLKVGPGESLLRADSPARHAALHSVSLHRDAGAVGELYPILDHDSAANRRLAAEAIGRIGNAAAVSDLLNAAGNADDRVLQHSIIYALIELAEPVATRAGIANAKSPKAIAAGLIALDQMPDGEIESSEVIRHLGASDETLRQAALWVVAKHSEWGGELAQWFQDQLKSLPNVSQTDPPSETNDALQNMLVKFAADPAVQQLLADAMKQRTSTTAAQAMVLRVMAGSKLQGPPKSWIVAITGAIANSDTKQLPLAIAAARRFPIASSSDKTLSQALATIADSAKYPLEPRVDAISILVNKRPKLSDAQFELLKRSLSAEGAVPLRSAAADAISKSHLSAVQLDQLCTVIQSVGPLELNRLLKPFDQSTDEKLGLKLVASLSKSAALPSLRMDLLRPVLAKYSPAVQKSVTELESHVNVDAAAQRKRIEELLPVVAKGDVRRGHAVFYSAKATCSSCHRLGNAGGTTGPELTHVGKTRTERDILESILYPSLSLVRSFEPMQVITQDGKIINGIVKEETAEEYVLATGPDQLTRVRRDEVEQMQPSTVSIMPAGLDKQLTPQELADLVMFLKNGAGH